MKLKDLELGGKPIVCANCEGGVPGTLEKMKDGSERYVHRDPKYCVYHVRKQKEERKKAELLTKRIES